MKRVFNKIIQLKIIMRNLNQKFSIKIKLMKKIKKNHLNVNLK